MSVVHERMGIVFEISGKIGHSGTILYWKWRGSLSLIQFSCSLLKQAGPSCNVFCNGITIQLTWDDCWFWSTLDVLRERDLPLRCGNIMCKKYRFKICKNWCYFMISVNSNAKISSTLRGQFGIGLDINERSRCLVSSKSTMNGMVCMKWYFVWSTVKASNF